MTDVFFAALYFLPAGIANASPVVLVKIPVIKNWNTPIDNGRLLNGKPLLGKNKTWRGLFGGVLVAALTGLVVFFVAESIEFEALQEVYSSSTRALLIGAVLGFGVLFGDAAESLIKRQRGIPSGSAWFPFDQTDYIVGGLLVAAPLGVLNLAQYIAIAIVWFGMHLLFSYIGFLLGLKKQPI